MKKLFFLALIITLVTYVSKTNAQYSGNKSYDANCGFWRAEYSPVNNNQNYSNAVFNWQFATTPVTSQMLDMIFIDSLFGWCSHTANGGVRTINSGANWTSFSFADTTFTTAYNGIYFINVNTGWCVGGSVQIRKTTNGGTNWFKQYGPPVSGINRSVWFADASTGYIAGSKGFPYQPFVAKTTNGGNNWTEITPATTGQELNDMHWLNVTTGWIAGYDVLLYTTTGGASFENRFANVPPTGNGHNSLLSVSFISQETGWIGAGNLERNNIYKTTNGGLNWTFQNNAVSQAGWNQINDVMFMSVAGDSGWAVHGTPSTGAIMFTSNGGTNWVMDNTQYSWYECLEIYNKKKVWCGGSSGRVWYTNIQMPPTTVINPVSNEIPEKFYLEQNYPNPFNPTTNFEFRISNFGFVRLNVYDVRGSKVAELINENLNPGIYKINFDGSNLNSGVYFYRLEATGFVETRKMILLK